ncbi:MAG: DUF6265 family protein [Pirellulaceae bacterium]|nr:DUF6265 family protein [Pirellulaceae bacterium]
MKNRLCCFQSGCFVLLMGVFCLLGCSQENRPQKPGDGDRIQPQVQEGLKEELAFLVGTWKVEGKDEYEEWGMTDQGDLQGSSYSLVGEKKEIFEYLAITKRNDEVIYTATVLDQNNGEGIEFVLQKHEEEGGGIYSFENMEHDFPNRIVYRGASDDRRTVEVLGNDGQGFTLKLIRQK